MNTRVMTASDRRFVAPTWVRSSRYVSCPRRERIEVVDRLLDRGRVITIVTDDTVHAWACVHAGLLHYVYVAAPLRGHGLARRLITEAFGSYPERIEITHPWPGKSERFCYEPLKEAA